MHIFRAQLTNWILQAHLKVNIIEWGRILPTNYKHCGVWTQQPQKCNEHRWQWPGEWITVITLCKMIVICAVTFFYKSPLLQSTQPDLAKCSGGRWQCWRGQVVFLEYYSCRHWSPGAWEVAALRKRVVCKTLHAPHLWHIDNDSRGECFRWEASCMHVEMIGSPNSQNNGNDLVFILFHKICEIYLNYY